MHSEKPLVSVVTPVYNGEKYLSECIESVLSQSHSHWEYTIVNNCSTDNTLQIALKYQQRDPRIKVISNDHFVGAIDNHNIAVRQISSESQYCKVVSADDWLYPESIERLVSLAESDPQIGILQGYVLNRDGVRWTGVPASSQIMDGQEAGRLYLLGQIEFAGIPSANLYRAALVRGADPLFPGSNPSADAAACLRCLQHCSFGFVHQILSFERIHDEAITTKVRKLESYLLDRIELVLEYGPAYLGEQELELRLKQMLDNYYRTLAAALVNGRGKDYWAYHATRARSLGIRLAGSGLGKALTSKLLDLALNPKLTLEKCLRRLRQPSGSLPEAKAELPALQ